MLRECNDKIERNNTCRTSTLESDTHSQSKAWKFSAAPIITFLGRRSINSFFNKIGRRFWPGFALN